MNVVSMIRPSLRAARIVYFTDMTKRDAPIVPLGAFGEVRDQNGYGLGLKARTSLTPRELAMIGSMLREKLTDPFKFLNAEFELAWGQAPGGAMDFLAHRHTAALSILAPHVVEHSFRFRHWFLERTSEAKLKDAVDREYSTLMREHAPAGPVQKHASPGPVTERIQLAA